MKLIGAIIGIFLMTTSLFSQAEVWYAKGQQALKSKNYEEAVEYFTRAVELDPSNYKYYEKRGLTYLYAEKPGQAIDDLTISVDINPKNADAYNNRGLAFSFQGDLDQAINDFNRAIDIDPNFGQAYLNRGSIYIQFKNFDAAMKDFNQAAKYEPNNPEVYYNRGRLHYSRENYKKAAGDFSKAIEKGLNLGKVFYNRGNAYFKQKKYKQSIKDYTKALSFDAGDLEALNNRAMAYDLSGQDKKAEADRKRLADIRGVEPEFPPVDKIKFKTYTDKEKHFWIDLPADWHAQTFADEEVSELIVSKEDPKDGGYAVGVRMVFNKKMKEEYDIQGIAELIAFWEGSAQKNADDYYDYRIYSKKTMSRGAKYKGSLNLVHVKVTSESYYLQIYEMVMASEKDLFYAYFQCPQVQFEYYKKIFDKAIKSFKIR